MSQATEMNSTTPLPTAGNFRMQMEGMASAVLYIAFFAIAHLSSNMDIALTPLLAAFFAGLILVPLLIALPMTLLRGALARGLDEQANIAASIPFANLALYALQALALWVITREGYHWAFTGPLAG